MTNEQARMLLTADQIAAAEAAGRAYGEQEAELLADQGTDPSTVQWADGEFCGDVPSHLSDEQKDAYETLLDAAAHATFDLFDADDYRARNPQCSL